jgi:DNA ligase (NAD+)
MDYFEYSDMVTAMIKWQVAYEAGTPVVDDVDWDRAYLKLKAFENANPTTIDPNSPTRKSHYGADGRFAKTKHRHPMLSIANSNGVEALGTWSGDTGAKGFPNQVLEFKIDGLALSLTYIDGHLMTAVTRGDGSVGDDVTLNAVRIPTIPKTHPLMGVQEIRGEVYWDRTKFATYNDSLEEMGKPKLSNPRNGAAGTLKSSNPDDVEERGLDFIAYSWVEGSPFGTQMEDLDYLSKNGFQVSAHYLCKSVEKILAGADYMAGIRHTLPFIIDGLVCKVNEKSAWVSLGGTSKTPHAFTALKWPPEEKATKLLGIEESCGRTGAITPVALLEEVELSQTKVRRASLHNWDVVEYLGLHVGCTVVVRKAAEIIPEIVQCVETGRHKEFYEALSGNKERLDTAIAAIRSTGYEMEWYRRPKVCPLCGGECANEVNSNKMLMISWICTNPSCSAKQVGNLVRFVERDAMNVMGVGESMVEQMVSAGIVQNIVDFYTIPKSKLLQLDGFAEKSADAVIAAFLKSKENTLDRLIVGLGISNIGRTASKELAAACGDLEMLISDGVRLAGTLQNWGPIMVRSFSDWMDDNVWMLAEFLRMGVATKAGVVERKGDALAGFKMIMTGTSSLVGREEFKVIVAQNGGMVTSSISKVVTHVLVGESAGPAKLKKIDDLNAAGAKITVITDTEFLKMVGRG